MLLPPKAGLLEVVCFINAIAAGGVAAILLLAPLSSNWARIVAFSTAALIVWVLEFRFVRERYRRGLVEGK